MTLRVPFFTTAHQDERYGHLLRAAIDDVVKSGHFILGPQVKRFEQRLAEYCGVKHAIGVANGSDALYLAVWASRLPAGAEVLTSPYTFFASAACVVRNGLKPVFVDCRPDTFHIDVDALEKALTPKTKAVLSIDLFSHTADNGALAAFCRKHNLDFIEDSAEAFGMRWDGRHAAASARVGVLSFFPTKTLGCFGDGGAILTNDDALAQACRIGRVHGAEKKYHHTVVGINSRLDELQAAVLNVKLDYVDAEIAERATFAAQYAEGLSNLPGITLPHVPEQATPAWYVFAPTFPRRDELARHLEERGIGTSVYWPKPLHLQDCFASLGHGAGDFPVAERLCHQSLALPMYVGLDSARVARVCDVVRDFYKG